MERLEKKKKKNSKVDDTIRNHNRQRQVMHADQNALSYSCIIWNVLDKTCSAFSC